LRDLKKAHAKSWPGEIGLAIEIFRYQPAGQMAILEAYGLHLYLFKAKMSRDFFYNSAPIIPLLHHFYAVPVASALFYIGIGILSNFLMIEIVVSVNITGIVKNCGRFRHFYKSICVKYQVWDRSRNTVFNAHFRYEAASPPTARGLSKRNSYTHC
jgi:hypothetical protein